MSTMRRLRVLALLSLAVAACTAEDFQDFLGADGGMDPAGSDAGAQPSAPGCNAIPLDGALVTPAMHSGTLIFHGGTPASGTYRLIKTEVTTGAFPRAERRTIVISGNAFEFASQGTDVTRWSATFTTGNVDMTVTRNCGGAGAVQTYKFTATGTTLAILSGSILYTYQR